MLAWPVAAQYPDHPVTVPNGYPAGGRVDIVAAVHLASGRDITKRADYSRILQHSGEGSSYPSVRREER